MTGVFYGVSVGPGDPELMTLKAVRLLKECPVIAVPQSGSQGEPVALSIARQAVPELLEKEFLELTMPMTRDQEKLKAAWEQGAQAVAYFLRQGLDVAFLTLGDASVYSTFQYLKEAVEKLGFETKVVAGVPSFCAAAALVGEGLVDGDTPLHLLPAACQEAEDWLDLPGTKVLMKSGKALPRIKEALKARGLSEKAWMVEKCGMEGEQVYPSIEQAGEDTGYFALIVVKG